MSDNAAHRRAAATVEIEALCKSILDDVAAGPRHKGRTTYQDADNFERIRDMLRDARFAALCMRGAA